MASIEGIATFAGAAMDLLSASCKYIIKGYNLSKNGIVKWHYRNDPIYEYKRILKKKYPYYFNKVNELPQEAQILFFRIYNTFRKRYLDKNITFLRYYNRSFTALYFPVSSLIKDASIQEIDIIMQILKHSGFIADYYNEDELDNMGDRYGAYFSRLKKTSDVSLKKGVLLIIPSQFGARCYLSAHNCEPNTPCEKFCSVKILNSESLDVATNFFAEEDIKDLLGNKY